MGPRRTRVVIKRIGPLSVLRWSLFFYFCIFLIFFFAAWFIYGVLDTAGILSRVGEFLGSLSLGTCTAGTTDSASTCVFKFDQGWIFSRLFVFGVVVVVVWSTITVLVSFLYNLVSDVIGGVELTLVERR
jgi:hypothetical protein